MTIDEPGMTKVKPGLTLPVVQPDDTKTVVRFDAVGVLHQRRLVDDHFLVGVGGVDEGQGVAFPVGVGDVGDVEAGRGGIEADDVARLDVPNAVGQVGLGDVPVVPSLEVLLRGADLFHVFRAVFQLLVGSGVRGHEVELLVELAAAAFAAHFVEDAARGALDDPFGRVVQARGVAVHLAVPVAELPEIVDVFVEGRFGVLGREGHGKAHLDEKDAIRFAGVDRQAFRLDLEGAGHVRCAEEMLGYLDDQVCHRQVAVGGYQVHHFVEVFHVFLREAGVAFLVGGAQDKPEEGGQKYDDAFHGQNKASL